MSYALSQNQDDETMNNKLYCVHCELLLNPGNSNQLQRYARDHLNTAAHNVRLNQLQERGRPHARVSPTSSPEGKVHYRAIDPRTAAKASKILVEAHSAYHTADLGMRKNIKARLFRNVGSFTCRTKGRAEILKGA